MDSNRRFLICIYVRGTKKRIVNLINLKFYVNLLLFIIGRELCKEK